MAGPGRGPGTHTGGIPFHFTGRRDVHNQSPKTSSKPFFLVLHTPTGGQRTNFEFDTPGRLDAGCHTAVKWNFFLLHPSHLPSPRQLHTLIFSHPPTSFPLFSRQHRARLYTTSETYNTNLLVIARPQQISRPPLRNRSMSSSEMGPDLPLTPREALDHPVMSDLMQQLAEGGFPENWAPLTFTSATTTDRYHNELSRNLFVARQIARIYLGVSTLPDPRDGLILEESGLRVAAPAQRRAAAKVREWWLEGLQDRDVMIKFESLGLSRVSTAAHLYALDALLWMRGKLVAVPHLGIVLKRACTQWPFNCAL